jgi:hypothetical protein
LQVQILPRKAIAKTYFFTLNAKRGRFNNSATQYPFIRKRMVRKP